MRDDWRRWLLLVLLLIIAAYSFTTVLPAVLKLGTRGAADFSIFYTGSLILRNGLAPHLYDLAVQAHFHSPFYRSHPLPFNHLAFELLLFLPFTTVPFSTAFWLWNAINVLFLAGFAWLMAPELKSLPRPAMLFILIAALAFFPVIVTLMSGQDSILLLLIYAVAYLLLKKDKQWLAGFVLAGALIKFPLLIPFVLPFVFRRQWEFLAGFVVGSAAVVGISIAITGFSGFLDYFHLLRFLATHPEVGYTNMGDMPVARGFFETILPNAPLLRFALVAVLSVALLAFTTKHFRKGTDEKFNVWFALNIAMALVVCPHLYRHDWTVLFLALLLYWNSFLDIRRTDGNSKLMETGALVTLTITFFATPLYRALNDHDLASLMFIPLLLFCLAVAASICSFRTNTKATAEGA